MAYTLNNVQPVVCTIVSDQPYFYMDEEETMSDFEDAILDEELNSLEHDLADLRGKMEAYERLSKTFQHEPERRIEQFMAEAMNITEPQLPAVVSLDHIPATLRESRMGLLMNGLVKIPMQFGILLIGAELNIFSRMDEGDIVFS